MARTRTHSLAFLTCVSLALFLPCCAHRYDEMIMWDGSAQVQVNVRVVDKSTSAPISNARVDLIFRRGIDASGLLCRMPTDSDGRASLLADIGAAGSIQNGVVTTRHIYSQNHYLEVSCPGFRSYVVSLPKLLDRTPNIDSSETSITVELEGMDEEEVNTSSPQSPTGQPADGK